MLQREAETLSRELCSRVVDIQRLRDEFLKSLQLIRVLLGLGFGFQVQGLIRDLLGFRNPESYYK